MSDTMMRTSTMLLLVAASCTVALPANAQVPADPAERAAQISALGARVDSLNAEYIRWDEERVRDARRPRDTTGIALDTVRIGPLLLAAPAGTDESPAAQALRAAWPQYERMVGTASTRVDAVIVTRVMPRGKMYVFGTGPVHLFDPYEPGRGGYLQAAHHVIGAVLTAALPAQTKDWLPNGSVGIDARLEHAYRTLVLARGGASSACLAASVSACLDMIGLHAQSDVDGKHVVGLRASLLAYALQRGGDNAYARLFTDTTSIEAQLANASGLQLEQLVADWRADMERARPNIRADVAQSGFWTLAWLALLAVFATRSTRWRTG